MAAIAGISGGWRTKAPPQSDPAGPTQNGVPQPPSRDDALLDSAAFPDPPPGFGETGHQRRGPPVHLLLQDQVRDPGGQPGEPLAFRGREWPRGGVQKA